MHAQLAAESAGLVAPKRAGRVILVVGVDPDGPGLKLSSHAVRLSDIAGPNRRRQAILGVVGIGDRFFLVLESNSREHWSKNFLARDGHVVLDAVENCRLKEIAFARTDLSAPASGDQLRALFLARFDVAHHLLQL